MRSGQAATPAAKHIHVGLPGEQHLYVLRGHMRSWPHHDELSTFQGETKQRRRCENGGSSCAMDERHCRHDMMMNAAMKRLIVLDKVLAYFIFVLPL